jgi:hypothetical protein
MRSGWFRLVPATAFALIFACLPPAAAAPGFSIPEGFVAEPGGAMPLAADTRTLVSVRPVDGPFADLSTIELRQVVGAIDEPDRWLRQRLTADVGSAAEAEAFLSSPDSPFADPSFDALRQALPDMLRGLQSLSQLPLSFCDGPRHAYNAAGELRELYCLFQFGPMRQYLVLRLQQADGQWFYTVIRSMNERRLRHLLAIANSFAVNAAE